MDYDRWAVYDQCLAAKQATERRRAHAEQIMTQLNMLHTGDTIIITKDISDAIQLSLVALRRMRGEAY